MLPDHEAPWATPMWRLPRSGQSRRPHPAQPDPSTRCAIWRTSGAVSVRLSPSPAAGWISLWKTMIAKRAVATAAVASRVSAAPVLVSAAWGMRAPQSSQAEIDGTAALHAAHNVARHSSVGIVNHRPAAVQARHWGSPLTKPYPGLLYRAAGTDVLGQQVEPLLFGPGMAA
jgi:hypothetical protein